MPVDTSPSLQLRRAARRVVNEDEIDVRRARGEISCAECRRLKLKCDKKLPCSSCVRRGCSSICPNGSLSTGQGTRFIPADTTQLHTKIAEMGQRIRQLEDALAVSHYGVSNEPHPLLREDLLAIKLGSGKSHIPDKDSHSPPPSVESIDAMGTVTIGDQGVGKYFGPSAGSETLLLAGAEYETVSQEDEVSPTVSADIARLSSSFPFGAETDPDNMLDLLYSYLPEQPRAWTLCETYLEHAAWSFRPIRREEIIDEILAPTYRALKSKQTEEISTLNTVSPHKLGALYIIFALGSLVDLTIEPYSQEAETYYQLCRASLALRSVMDFPEVATVQAVLLMALYHGMAGKRYTMDSSWALTTLAAKLAQSLGLHRDSARWNLDAKTVQRRRSLFWEMTSVDFFYSLALGRPPSIRLSYVDCEFPEDGESSLDENGNTLVGHYRWKHEFCRDIISSVLEQTLTAEAPQYKTILELDHKVREMRLPSHLNVFMSPEEEHFTPSVYMRGCTLGQFRAVTLLYIHRSWFAQAMLDHPVNPLKSPYAPSFLAAYRCASGVIQASSNHFDRFPELCRRWWGVWTHLFSAAVIVGSIVTRSPSSNMAPTAYVELGQACDLFEKGATNSRRARSGLAILYKLRQQAFQAYSQFRGGNLPTSNSLTLTKSVYGGDELALFGGQTRVLVTRLLSITKGKRSGLPTSSSTSPCLTNSTASSPAAENENSRSSSTPTDGSLPEVHPSLVEYLSAFPPPSSSSPQSTTDVTYTTQSTSRQEDAFYTFTNTWPNWQPPPPVQDNLTDTLPTTSSYPHPMEVSYSSTAPASVSSISQFPVVNALESDVGSSEPEGAQLMDLGMMMSGDSGMDEQWISFMRESGLMDTGTHVPISQAGGNSAAALFGNRNLS